MIARRVPRLTDHQALWLLASVPVRIALVVLVLVVWIASAVSVVAVVVSMGARRGAAAATHYLRSRHGNDRSR